MPLPSRRFCLMRFEGSRIIGWVIADNLSDIRLRAGKEAADRMADASITPCQYDLGGGYVLLVDLRD